MEPGVNRLLDYLAEGPERAVAFGLGLGWAVGMIAWKAGGFDALLRIYGALR
jgi:hypothetical protein